MIADIVCLPMRRAPCALRIVAIGKTSASPASGARLLSLHDAAHEQRIARQAAEACRAAVEQSLHELRHLVDSRLQAIAAMTTELGLAVAREIVGHSLARGTFDPLPVVRRCLQQATTHGERGKFVVRLSPADHARVQQDLASDTARELTFLADATLSPGSVRVESDLGAIAYDPAQALQRLSEELRRELAAC